MHNTRWSEKARTRELAEDDSKLSSDYRIIQYQPAARADVACISELSN